MPSNTSATSHNSCVEAKPLSYRRCGKEHIGLRAYTFPPAVLRFLDVCGILLAISSTVSRIVLEEGHLEVYLRSTSHSGRSRRSTCGSGSIHEPRHQRMG